MDETGREETRAADEYPRYAEWRAIAQWHIDHDSRPIGHEHYPEAVVDLLDEIAALRALLDGYDPSWCLACGGSCRDES